MNEIVSFEFEPEKHNNRRVFAMYSEQELEQQPLIDDDQWGRLESELGLEMLQEFAQEFFEETREIWFASGVDPFSMDEKSFKSMAHRSAGAAGTIGFKKLRFVFLCMEHTPLDENPRRYLTAMAGIFQSTQEWVQNNQ